MPSNLDRLKKDLDELLLKGILLDWSIQRACFPAEFETRFRKTYAEDAQKLLNGIPAFHDEYQSWYSEAQALVKQLLPDRLSDFVRHYEKPRPRKDITSDTYRIEDYLQGLSVTRGPESHKVVGPDAAIPHFRQQLAIVRSAKARFESSLFDIRRLMQADLFDSELDAADELAKHKFARAAGALAGVVLERHLREVCDNRGIKITKKAPGIAVLNDALKDANVIDVPEWRFIQHLADIRNLCDHSKKTEPTVEQVKDLIAGVKKVTKTVA